MPTDKERVCCKQRQLCRSQSQVFKNICIDSDNVATVIRSLADTYVFTPTYDNRAMRHAAYRQYIMWQHGHLGQGHRRVIPACCVWEIRKHHPSPDGHYTGYKVIYEDNELSQKIPTYPEEICVFVESCAIQMGW